MARKKLWLNDLKNTRRSLAGIIRDFHGDQKADVQRYRCETYMLKALLDYFRTELGLPILPGKREEGPVYDYRQLSSEEVEQYFSLQKKSEVDKMKLKRERVIELLNRGKARREIETNGNGGAK